MKNLCSLVLPVAVRGAHTTCPAVSAIGMMAVVEREEDLHEIVPDGVFGNESVMPLGLFDDGGEVAASAEFHENVQDARIAVNVSVVIAYNVFVMEVLEDVARKARVGAVVEWYEHEIRTLPQQFVCDRALSCAQS